ncbi:putative MFS-type transporter YhjX [Pseudovibrio axinellae]|uniref:Putative MFS-type transporter YhjX n=1 Tax=Pseudovibrio axinellae TaxID=989403 RepID=A0A165YGH7_9HYPH|nr:MFS transporter [Pseudovibrio axinellae]KZL18823.1 putative MFS-type transporter YhjX [Pseudovibrio axinellae]SEP91526.1 Cyanate permease [Pseudovibrio axinellae]
MPQATQVAERSSRRYQPNVPLIILSGCIIGALSFGPRATLGLFLTPMSSEFGWGRDVFAFALALQNLMWGVAQPFAGMMADKFGTGRTLVLGAAIYATGLFLMSMSDTPLLLQVSAGVLVGLGVAFTSFSLVLAAFARSVQPKYHGIAFGIGTAASSFGQFLFAPLGLGLIDNFGWSNALVYMAALVILVPLFAYFLRGQSAAAKTGGSVDPQNTMTLSQALALAFKTRDYILLIFGFFVCGFHVAFITVHMPTFIVDQGFSVSLGAWALALIGLFNIIGCMFSGVLGSRVPKQYLLSVIYLARAIAITLYISLPISEASTLIFAATMGVLWLSTVPPTSGLVAIMFGPRFMATLFGIVFLFHQIGSFLGVWLGGVLYEKSGNYDAIWWLGIALGIFAAIVHWPIREQSASKSALVRAPA